MICLATEAENVSAFEWARHPQYYPFSLGIRIPMALWPTRVNPQTASRSGQPLCRADKSDQNSPYITEVVAERNSHCAVNSQQFIIIFITRVTQYALLDANAMSVNEEAKFRPHPFQTPKSIWTSFQIYHYVCRRNRCAKFGLNRLSWDCGSAHARKARSVWIV